LEIIEGLTNKLVCQEANEDFLPGYSPPNPACFSNIWRLIYLLIAKCLVFSLLLADNMESTKTIIGRKIEQQILQTLLASRQPELLAVYGRRRVGKTFLIRQFFTDQLVFSCSGQLNSSTPQQLFNFTEQLQYYFPTVRPFIIPGDWQQAFASLWQSLSTLETKTKKVIFFDELPWLDTHKSGFLAAFDYFWNMHASTRNDLIVVICGSAASWIIKKVVNNKGGLHNRITQRIRLLPFNLQEADTYLQHKNIKLNHYQLLQLYMTIGGIPHYLNGVKRGKSVPQIIEEICFSKDGMLYREFDNLYEALFSSAEKHIQVIQALARKNKSITRNELLETAKLSTGGGISMVLEELEESGFIEKLYPLERKLKDALYRLTDEFSLFYMRFMKGAKIQSGQWLSQAETPANKTWCGYAFENICIKHIQQIKIALGIAAVQATTMSWQARSVEDTGAQIDMLIERRDQTINICEMKFSTTEFTIDKKYAGELENKFTVFRRETQTKKTLLLTLITTYGLKDNVYKQQLVDNEISMDVLFEKV
jgi:predicted AAA+ superfamily ATPase